MAQELDRKTERTPVDALFAPVAERASITAWSVVLVVAAAVAAIYIQVPTIHAFQLGLFFNAVAIVLIVGAVVAAVCLAVTRDLEFAVRCAVATTITVFWWSIVVSVVSSFADRGLADALTVVVATVIALGILFYGRARAVITLVAVMAGLVAIQSAQAVAELSMLPQPMGSIIAAIDPQEPLPNVLVLVLDGHPRDDTLKTIYSASGEQFLESLAELGVRVKRTARSNYNRSYASVSSMLALDAMFTPEGDPEAALSMARSVNGGDGEFLRAFEKAGYAVTFVPSSWAGSYCGAIVDRCVNVGQTRSNLYWLLKQSLFAPLVEPAMRHPWTDVSLRQIRSIADIHIDGMRSDTPSITWMHVALPHPPVALSRDCTVLKDAWRNVYDLTNGGPEDSLRRDAFVEQTECVDSIVVEEIRMLLEADPTAAVLILSDHGPDGLLQPEIPIEDYTPEQTREKLAVLTGFRGPDRCEAVLAASSTVLVMREVVRCLLNANVLNTPVASYLVPPEPLAARVSGPILVPPEELP